MPNKWSRKIKQSYIAAALYIDDLIGILMSYVDTRNTIVVLTSDHGWSLGENGLWAKYSNFDVALRVPLVINAPGIEPKEITAPVELIDIFPTLVDIAFGDENIPKCRDSDEKNELCFEGKSLLPLIDDEQSPDDYVAMSQYPRPSVYPERNSDKPRLKDIKIMGYSIRTRTLRYTEWISFNSTCLHKNWKNNYGIELYNHTTDPTESKNLYLDPYYLDTRKELSALLRTKVG
ncbi:unnamed protein product [Plutella xylostella]|uniref:(diamondback moth) hypothetical protein n=1 Tax=Plutella xylostella TaxID=51655 RepID=A0A8S4D342_PLUXY|nr:unnamed protein product [Plutella xylostella]